MRIFFASWRKHPGALTAAGSLYFFAFTAVLIVRPFDGGALVAFSDIGGLIAPFTATGLVLLAAGTATHSARRAWLYLGFGVLSWGVGDLIWACYEVALVREIPFPSLADVFYLLGYVLMFLGVLLFSHRGRVSSSLRTTLDAITVTLAGFALVWRVALEPLFLDSSLSVLEISLSALYPAADLLLLFGVSLAVFRNRDRQAGTVFGVLGSAMLVFLVTDMAFAYMQSAGTYASGTPVDAGWTLGFLLAGYGGLLQLSWRPQHSLQVEEPSDSAGKQGMPLVIMLLVISWTVFDGLHARLIDIPLLGATLLTVGVVVMRQFLTLRENIRLRLVLEAAYRTERERARLDPLTGRLNRRAVVELVETLLLSSAEPDFALAMVDVNGMKQINDAYGHHAGDDALASVAAALSKGATVGRYGGDEFLAVLERATPETAAAHRDTVLAALEIWSASRDDGLRLSVSIGFAYAPAEGRSAGELIKAADRRMYEIKRWAAAA